jgi:hypothetical protein
MQGWGSVEGRAALGCHEVAAEAKQRCSKAASQPGPRVLPGRSTHRCSSSSQPTRQCAPNSATTSRSAASTSACLQGARQNGESVQHSVHLTVAHTLPGLGGASAFQQAT